MHTFSLCIYLLLLSSLLSVLPFVNGEEIIDDPEHPKGLVVLLKWKGVHDDYSLTKNDQLAALELIPLDLKHEHDQDVVLDSFHHDLGKTNTGEVMTMGILLADNDLESLANENKINVVKRSILSIDDEDDLLKDKIIADKKTIEYSLKTLSDQKKENSLKDKIMRELKEVRKRDGREFSFEFNGNHQRRGLLDFAGSLSHPILDDIIIGEQRIYSKADRIKVSTTGTPANKLTVKDKEAEYKKRNDIIESIDQDVKLTDSENTKTGNIIGHISYNQEIINNKDSYEKVVYGQQQQQQKAKRFSAPVSIPNKNKKKQQFQSCGRKSSTILSSTGNKQFESKYVVSGEDAHDFIKSSENLRRNLDRLNGPIDGNTAIPDIFNPPQRLVHVLIFDTVVYLDHSEFSGRITEEWNGHPDEVGVCETHGTQVASVAIGGTVGVARNAIGHSFRILNCDGYAYTSDIVAGLTEALAFCQNMGGRKEAFVAVASWGGPGDPNGQGAAPIAYLMGELYSKCGMQIVVAGGNNAIDACGTVPGGFKSENQGGVFTVGASNAADEYASFSNYGPCIDLFGIGVDVTMATTSGPYAYSSRSGTSFSAPLLAGVFALHYDRQPDFWDDMFPYNRFAHNIKVKVLSDAVPALRKLPTRNTTPRLAQINNIPIANTIVLQMVAPVAASPHHLSNTATSSASSTTKGGLDIVGHSVITLCLFILLAFTLDFVGIPLFS